MKKERERERNLYIFRARDARKKKRRVKMATQVASSEGNTENMVKLPPVQFIEDVDAYMKVRKTRRGPLRSLRDLFSLSLRPQSTSSGRPQKICVLKTVL